MGSRWDFVKTLGKKEQPKQAPEAVPLQPVNKKPGDRPKDVELGQPAAQPGALANFKNKLTTGLLSGTDKAKKLATNTNESIQTSINFSKNLPYIIVLVGAGIFFLILAFIFMSLILVAPEKFSLAFALGGGCFLGAISLVREPNKFFKSLFEGELKIWSIVYFVAIAGTLCSALVFRSKPLALAFAISQVIALSYIISVSVPGGKMIVKAIKTMVQKACSCIFSVIFRR